MAEVHWNVIWPLDIRNLLMDNDIRRNSRTGQDGIHVLPLEKRPRHKSLWYADGSVILATPRMLFRVYRGILSQHSPVFHDMFSLPQSSDVSQHDTMDGVPVVHLHDDPTELAHLLSAIHDRE